MSSLSHAVNIESLKDCESKLSEYLADLQAAIQELKNAAPQNDEERHHVFLLKKQVMDTLVERVAIDKNRELKVEIRLNLLEILDKDVALAMPHPAYIDRDEIYTRISDSCRIVQIWL